MVGIKNKNVVRMVRINTKMLSKWIFKKNKLSELYDLYKKFKIGCISVYYYYKSGSTFLNPCNTFALFAYYSYWLWHKVAMYFWCSDTAHLLLWCHLPVETVNRIYAQIHDSYLSKQNINLFKAVHHHPCHKLSMVLPRLFGFIHNPIAPT